jgi:hypothetical protein
LSTVTKFTMVRLRISRQAGLCRAAGKVSQVEGNVEFSRQMVKVILKDASKYPGFYIDKIAYWTLPKSAISIQTGDFICLLEGTSKPKIIRLRDDHFLIVMIAAVPSEQVQKAI